MKKLLHTPEGVRDIYNVECGKKLALEARLKKVFHLYGYHDIQTPTFEYFDVFRKEIGTISSRELYKFFDKEGNTLVLRPDFTPSIARAAATLFQEETLPIRLCYTGSTFVNHSSYQGRLKESTQMGAELLGDDSAEADAEMLALVIESMLTIGLKEFQLTVSNVAFIESLIEDAALKEEEQERVRELIINRNYYGAEEYLDSIQVKRSTREAFASLNGLLGGVDILEKAKNIAPNSRGVMALRRLEKIYDLLKLYGVEKFVTFDLSMMGTYGYYTGIIFRGYTYGTGDAIVKGGRYDHLIEKFGKQSASIGVGIVIDELMNALTRQKIRILYTRKNTMILYDEGRQKEAIALAKDFRSKAKNIELIKKAKDKLLEQYVEYGKEYYAGNLIYIKKSGEITMINLVSGEEKTLNGTDRS
ncbi:ATP phosphoribosyltransferase regulatory subunit [Mordavella massiliensis]|jgi:ATP phosphoribosyltransferase regulatory subunit|uniref:ATP phosphoribosyltransferase regulatory subunit n=1 Tax=Mordavella massiliensis TaxID=1871024 RepID=A0A938WYJ3_9CLOT|nr:ATP phosphoribosyltransferase regulatory subunit [Mordavella massiliensis]MBM6826021.1 ATP phosphoribosyltransferase regulatory subunit [Mordavella massiliensis]MBM6970137.1 ATP phosphoribosyltransferase regulatory subunit [Mordavella massiliensis]HJB86685.1 ATP phosphoribosyltransferase regulatory subunit [Candidatus Dorea faecigallinarum]